jgi:hypothetical protein
MVAAQRRTQIEDLFLRCKREWREFLYELDTGEGDLQSDEPFQDLDTFLSTVEVEERAAFSQALLRMIESDDPEDQALALTVVASSQEPFDMAPAVALEDELSQDLEAHVALLLAIGQRRFEEGRPCLDRALKNSSRRHAALIAMAQLDPQAAAPLGREVYQKDRQRILSMLNRPLREHEYETFAEMAIGVLQVHGKDGLNEFLRAVAGEDTTLGHEVAYLARRLLRQSQ